MYDDPIDDCSVINGSDVNSSNVNPIVVVSFDIAALVWVDSVIDVSVVNSSGIIAFDVVCSGDDVSVLVASVIYDSV